MSALLVVFNYVLLLFGLVIEVVQYYDRSAHQ
jgi:hypothetical protein